MRELFKRRKLIRTFAFLMSLVLCFSGVSSVTAIDNIMSEGNHHYLIYADMDSLFDKMVQAYNEDAFAVIGSNILLPMTDGIEIAEGKENIQEIENKLVDKYLIDTVEISNGLMVYLTVNVSTLEFYFVVSNATGEEHEFTIAFADGIQCKEEAVEYSFTEIEVEAPIEEASEIETPVEETPTIEAPESGTPIEETPTTEVPEIKTPVEGSTIIEAPESETSIEETPITEIPEVEALVEVTPPTEIPSVDQIIQEDNSSGENIQEEISVLLENSEKSQDIVSISSNSMRMLSDFDLTGTQDFVEDVDNSSESTKVTVTDSQPEVATSGAITKEEPSEGTPTENEIEEELKEDEKNPLIKKTMISSKEALNELGNGFITFAVSASSANLVQGIMSEILEVAPTIDKTDVKNIDGSYTIDLSVEGDQDTSTITTPISVPINLIFSIDVSGSMDDKLSGTNDSKWKTLVREMNSMIDYVLTSNNQSKISIVAYSSIANIIGGAPFYKSLITMSSDATAIKSSYATYNNGQNVWNPKSLSDIRGYAEYTNNESGFLGVKEKIAAIPSSNINQTYVIYMTDGEANRYLRYNTSLGYVVQDSANTTTCVNEALEEARLLKSIYPSVKIFTIGIGSTQGMKNLLNPSTNPYQTAYYNINSVADMDNIFTALSGEMTTTNTIYVTQMTITDAISDYVTLKPDSYVITYNDVVIYDAKNNINTYNWTAGELPAYNNVTRTIVWDITDQENRLDNGQTYVLSYDVMVNNTAILVAPPEDILYAYLYDMNGDGLKEVRYFNVVQANLRGLTESDRFDDEMYYPSNKSAVLDYYNGSTIVQAIFPHPGVKADVPGTLIIRKDTTGDATADLEFEFEVMIGENGAVPTLYNGSTMEGDVITNGILKLESGETATIKATNIDTSYKVTELTYVDESGYTDSYLEEVNKTEVVTVSRAEVFNGIVTPTIVLTGLQVSGNLYTTRRLTSGDDEINVDVASDVIIDFTNHFTIIDGSIRVGKQIDNFLSQHGNATFFFRLDKLDNEGTIIKTDYDFVEFSSSTNNTMAVFDHLPKGYYKLTEIEPIRYEFNLVVTATGANADKTNALKENNGEILFEITAADQDGTAVYSNKKIYHKYFSHTDVVRNTVHIMASPIQPQ